MKAIRIVVALILLIVPSVVRGVWFYQGIYSRTAPIPTPDYVSLVMPTPPLATPQAEQPSAPTRSKTVLVDSAHKNVFDFTELDIAARALAGLGAHLEVVAPAPSPTSISSSNSSSSNTAPSPSPSSLNTMLKYADAFVVIAPNAPFTSDEVQEVQRFVEHGGRLLVIADPTRGSRFDSVTFVNSLVIPFDLTFSDDYLYNLIEYEGNYRNVLFHKFAADPLTEGLGTVALYAAHSVGTTTGTPLVQGDENTLSSRTDTGGHLAALALSANQQVLALGDLTFLTSPYYQVADNAVLINRLAQFLLGGERTRALADFPFVFSQPVVISPTRNVTLTADLATSLSKLQSSLTALDISVSMTAEPLKNSDLIVLGQYAPSNDLLPYLKPFISTLPEVITSTLGKSTSISVPGVGNLARANTGVMLFSRTDERATLILLADDSDTLSKLMGVLASGDTSACAIQEQMALCNLSKPKPEPSSSSDQRP